MRCLVTGAGGLLGSYLVEHLLSRGCEVHAFARGAGQVLAAHRGEITLHRGSVLDQDALSACIETANPDVVYHMAAQSLPGTSWDDPHDTYRTNILGTTYLFEALRSRDGAPLVIIPGSSSAYAASTDPIDEEGALAPLSPYAVSKLSQEKLATMYAANYGLRVLLARPFFLIGPRKKGDVTSDLARRIVAIEQGEPGPLRVGNLDAVRDFLDVRDGVEALVLLAEKGRPGEVYNICSGKGYAISELLEMLKQHAKADIEQEVDPDLLRPLDEPVKVGTPGKLAELGWTPMRSIEQTVGDILAYWRTNEG